MGQPVVVSGRVGQYRVDGGEVVEVRLGGQVQPPLGLPQLRGVRERGRVAGLMARRTREYAA